MSSHEIVDQEMSTYEECKICLLILVGLPGCGKTTFSSHLGSSLEKSSEVNLYPFQSVIHICYDKIIYQYEFIQWNEARKQIAETVGKVVGKLKQSIIPLSVLKEKDWKIYQPNIPSRGPKNILIIIDDNMYYRSMRYQYYKIARAHKLSFCQLFFKCSVDTCLIRNSQRSIQNQIPQKIILNMAANLEEPNMSNSWEMFSFSINAEKPYEQSSLTPLLLSIHKTFSSPVQGVSELALSEKVQSKNICSTNLLHKTDLILRKIVGNAIKENKDLDNRRVQELSKYLQNKKQTLLQNVKGGKLILPDAIITGVEEGHTGALLELELLISEWFIKGSCEK